MILTTTLIVFVLVAGLVQFGYEKQAVYGVLLVIVGALAYRYFLLDEAPREIVIAMALCGGLLVIGAWGAMELQRIVDDFKKARN